VSAPSIADLTTAVATAWAVNTRQVMGRERQTTPREYLYASGMEDCARWMALDLLHPEDRQPFDDDTLERFWRGDEAEEAKNARLYKVGKFSDPPFRPEQQQSTVEIHDREGKVLLARGKVEGLLHFHTLGLRIVYEVKSGMAVARVETMDDMFRSPWTRKYLRQLCVYLYGQVLGGRGNGLGMFILDQPGLPRLLPVDLQEDRFLALAEETLTGAEMAVAARRGAELPVFSRDPGVCQRCPHLGKSCHPSIMGIGEGVEVDDDPDAAETLQTYLDTAEAAREHERASKRLFEAGGRYRGRGQVLVAGRYLVTGKWEPKTKYDVPEDVKLQFKKIDDMGAWKKKILPLMVAAKGEGDAKEEGNG
jgi:hypothetical protein